MSTSKKNRGSVPGPNDDYREIRVKIRAGHPLFPEISALKHADAADLLSTLILEGITWQRRVGPILEMMTRGGQVDFRNQALVGEPKSEQTKPASESAHKTIEISGEDVLESFGLSR